jgi:2-succinyl-6-hydroxy-2,4-cyclohexadiene-1-carboxylate synthase
MRVQVGDVQMHVEIWEPGRPSPLLLLHGFTGSSASWKHVLGALGRERRLIVPDLLGHGHSDAPSEPERYVLARQVEDLIALLDRLGVECTSLLGYSMGGRIALRLALAAPERVTTLILESTSPGIADPAERAARREADEALAERLQCDGLEAFVDRWEGQPLFATQRCLPPERRAALRAQRLQSSAAGLAASLRGAGAGATGPVWDRLPALRIPTLFIAGALDVKYVAIGEATAQAIPRSRLAIVPDAGHTVHLERPDAWTETVLTFLEEYNECRYGGNPVTATPISSTTGRRG